MMQILQQQAKRIYFHAEADVKQGIHIFTSHDIVKTTREKELKTTMTDKLKVQERIARGDGSVAPHHESADAKTRDHKPVPG